MIIVRRAALIAETKVVYIKNKYCVKHKEAVAHTQEQRPLSALAFNAAIKFDRFLVHIFPPH